MRQNAGLYLLYLCLLGGVTIGLSYHFGSNGIEAFLAAVFGLFILLGVQTAAVVRLFSRQYGYLVGAVSALFIAILWLSLVFVLWLFIATYLPRILVVTGAQINWLIVLFGFLPYTLPRLLKFEDKSAQLLSVDVLVTVYSLLASIAAFAVADQEFARGYSIAFVLVVEAQVILSFMYSKTRYVTLALETTRASFGNNNVAAFVAIARIGIPLLLPILILALW